MMAAFECHAHIVKVSRRSLSNARSSSRYREPHALIGRQPARSIALACRLKPRLLGWWSSERHVVLVVMVLIVRVVGAGMIAAMIVVVVVALVVIVM